MNMQEYLDGLSDPPRHNAILQGWHKVKLTGGLLFTDLCNEENEGEVHRIELRWTVDDATDPDNGSIVFDWFDTSTLGMRRFAMILRSIGFSFPSHVHGIAEMVRFVRDNASGFKCEIQCGDRLHPNMAYICSAVAFNGYRPRQ